MRPAAGHRPAVPSCAWTQTSASRCWGQGRGGVPVLGAGPRGVRVLGAGPRHLGGRRGVGVPMHHLRVQLPPDVWLCKTTHSHTEGSKSSIQLVFRESCPHCRTVASQRMTSITVLSGDAAPGTGTPLGTPCVSCSVLLGVLCPRGPCRLPSPPPSLSVLASFSSCVSFRF